MKKKIILQVPKVNARITPPSHLVITKIHDSEKDHRRKKVSVKNINRNDLDVFDDRFYD